MFKVVIKTKNKTGVVRADIINYKAIANVMYTTNMASNAMYYSSNSQTRPIRDYVVTLFTNTGNTITIGVDNEKDLNEFIDQLVLAEEEQMTTSSISMEELYQYAAEKILGNKHESFPGIKLSVIEVNGRIWDNIDVAIDDSKMPNTLYTHNTSTSGGFKHGF